MVIEYWVQSQKDKTQGRQCKMLSYKKLTCKGTLRPVLICLKPRTPYPPPPHLTHCIRIYSILIHTWKGGGGERVETERRLEGQQFTNLGRKIPTWLTASPAYKLWLTPSLYRSILLDDDILLWCPYSSLVHEYNTLSLCGMKMCCHAWQPDSRRSDTGCPGNPLSLFQPLPSPPF